MLHARAPRSIALAAVVAALAVVATGCALPGSAPTGSPGGSAAAPTRLVVGLGYIPSVQFAPFYHAQQAGLYTRQGLTVEFQNKIDPDLVTLVGQGAVDVGLADGTSVIPAVSQGIPIRYVATVYGDFPSIVFADASSGIEDVSDLESKRLGIPGRYGSSWIMLQALLASADLTPEDLEVVEYPDFGQGVAVQQGAVDAATGFINNEPIQLEQSGGEPVVLRVDEVVPLPGPGLITGTRTLETKREALGGFVAATLEAMEEISEDPEVGVEAAVAAVPDLGQDRDVQTAILEATIDAWQRDDGEPLGTIDPGDWDRSIAFMTDLDLVPEPIDAADAIDTSLLGAAE